MRIHRLALPFLLSLGAIAGWLVPATGYAQRQATAIPGTPFGVGSVTLPTRSGDTGDLFWTNNFAIEEAGGRVFYPAFTNGLLRGLVEAGSTGEITVSFLFTGDAPLQITIYSPRPQVIDLQPQVQAPRIFNRELTEWWRNYNASARQLASENDFPPLVHTYLTSMLGNRLGLQPPLLSRLQESKQPTELQQTMELLAGTENVRAGLMREAMRSGARYTESADQPLPGDVFWSPEVLPAIGQVPDVEAIALHVPEECFYVRFGSFANYIWLSKLTREYGGDIGRMVTLRGHDAKLDQKTQRQLALKESALSELLGGTVIADVALIGRDMYMQDGAATGVLFQAKSSFVLATGFNQERSAAVLANKDRGATLETINLDGHKVSLLSTPDNYLRSYYATHGDFHLITTSREIARRFFEASDGGSSLGNLPEFQHARQVMPTERDDTIFAYFSAPFFRGLVSPQYQIELSRRLRATTNIQLVTLAKLAANSEGKPADTIDQLIDGAFLPVGFGRNVDGSGPILERNRVLDSLRGEQGSFTPIPDVELRGVTASEAAHYSARALYYQENWRQMDPLMVGIKRYALGDTNIERLVVDANISPLAEEKYGRLMSMIGPPTDIRIVTPPDELISVQASLRGGTFAPSVVPHHLFFGVRDAPPNANLQPNGMLEMLTLLRETPGYLGAWPQLGFLDMLPLGLGGGQPDPYGFSRLLFGLWRWQGDGFSVLSFHRDVLDRTIPELHVEPTDNPAQIRVKIGDVSRSHLSNWFSFMSYERATQTSVGNAKLLQAMTQQLGVPREQALETTESLLAAKLVCSLNGTYALTDRGDGLPTWRSDKWPVAGQPFPADYNAPVLDWFRGLNLDLTKHGDRMVMHAELDMQRAPEEKMKLELPLFNLFSKPEGETREE
ncbi:MAG: hypothetical protein H6823_10135 [Planctomycetaceae bacterium]|nr:hypothetical protein [Planctomycetaceae bacterium]